MASLRQQTAEHHWAGSKKPPCRGRTVIPQCRRCNTPAPCSSLRWHNPDQVQRVGVGGDTPRHPLSPVLPGSPGLL